MTFPILLSVPQPDYGFPQKLTDLIGYTTLKLIKRIIKKKPKNATYKKNSLANRF